MKVQYSSALLLIIGGVVVMGAHWGGAWRRSGAHLETARAWEKSGEEVRALSHYQWAARAYAWGSRSGPEAMRHLWRIGQSHDSTHPERALFAYNLMRGAIWSTRGLNHPYEMWRARVDEAIARHRSAQHRSQNMGNPMTAHQWRALLSADPRPSPEGSGLLLLSALALCSSLFFFIRSGLTHTLAFTPQARFGMLSCILSIILFYGVLMNL